MFFSTFFFFAMSLLLLRLDGVVAVDEWEKIAGTSGDPPLGGDTHLIFAMPNKGSKGQVGFFGGFVEAPDYSGATQPSANAFYNDIHIYDIDTKTWSEVTLPVAADKPSERGFVCGAYHEGTDALYVFGGSTYTNLFSEFNFFDDTWMFDFQSSTWTDITYLSLQQKPKARAASGCALIGDDLYLFSGNVFDFSIPNDLWKLNVVNKEWTELPQSSGGNVPPGRIQPNMGTLSGGKFILLGGEFFPGGFPGSPSVLEDVWTYDVHTSQWTQLNTMNKPEIPHEFQAFSVVSDKYFLTQSGDAQGDLTGIDTCPWLADFGGCFTPATPTRDTIFYRIISGSWEEVEGLADAMPDLKRCTMALIDNTLYLFGGYDWVSDINDPNGFGKKPNTNVYKLELPRKYLV